MKYTIAARVENRNTEEEVFKIHEVCEYGKVKLPEESFLLSFLWFPRGFVVDTVVFITVSLGSGGEGEDLFLIAFRHRQWKQELSGLPHGSNTAVADDV